MIGLHEGTSEAKLAKRDLLRSQLGNLRLDNGESVANLHSKLKEILTGLKNLGELMSNRDIIQYTINVFPRTTQWASILDSFYISKNLKVCTLDEFFSTMKLHES